MKRFRLDDYATAGLPLMVWRQQARGEQAAHRHDCIEMVYVTSGAGVTAVNGCHYPVVRGDLYVMNARDTHAFASEHSFNYYNIMFKETLFSPRELTELHRFPLFSQWFNVETGRERKQKKYSFPPPAGDRIERHLDEIAVELRRQRPGYQLLAKSQFAEMLIYILRSTGTETAGFDLNDNLSGHAVAKALSYINRHYREQLTVAMLARAAGISPSYLGERFRRETGTSLFDYICRLRIEKARQSLEESDAPISEIAAELGFCDTSYFSRSFHRFTGISPRQYRNMVASSNTR